MKEIWTLEVLRNLKAGQVNCYYTGNFPADIERNENDGASSYASILRQVEDGAKDLEAAGKLRLWEKKHTKKNWKNKQEILRLVEYYAVGMDPCTQFEPAVSSAA